MNDFDAPQINDFEYRESGRYRFIEIVVTADNENEEIGGITITIEAPVVVRPGETPAQLRARAESAVLRAIDLSRFRPLLERPE